MLPKVAIVGGPDVNARLELMQALRSHFEFLAFGTATELETAFRRADFAYDVYVMSRRVNPMADMRMLFSLIRLFQQHKPSLVHAFDTKPCVFARIAARLSQVPVVIGTIPGLGALYADERFATKTVRVIYEPLQRLACCLSDLTIFQNPDDLHQFIARGIVSEIKARVVLGSGVRTDHFDPTKVTLSEQQGLREALGISPKDLLVTMISRVIRSKGVMEFAAAAQHVQPQRPQVSFLLVGPMDKASADNLTASERASLVQSVTWAGERRDIPVILATSDIFVLPSFYREGVPRVLMEAASMGLPIVTTDSPGCNIVVEDSINGFLVPARDSQALVEAILRLVEHSDLRQRFGQISRQRAVERFDLSYVAEQTRTIYQELLARKGLLSGTDM